MQRMHKSWEINACVFIDTCPQEGKSYDIVMPRKRCSIKAEAKEHL